MAGNLDFAIGRLPEGPSRAPYWTFTDPLVYAREQERIFRGRVWHYVGLEAEVANPGDFKATQIGESPVLITRGEDGKVYGMLNRCAHRGNLVSMKENGNTKEFYCVYHAIERGEPLASVVETGRGY